MMHARRIQRKDFSPRPPARILHNPLPPRPDRSFPMIGKNFPMVGKNGRDFPMIGKIFSNGWKNAPIFPMIEKIFRQFSNDWKKFSARLKS
ncbi:MAG: hypothetical protein IKQ55_11960 [Kiritimatiellae bacterium]|nr:hypothetical protein [Kiritimatiellia bacterium]